jgi:hypothetical protein
LTEIRLCSLYSRKILVVIMECFACVLLKKIQTSHRDRKSLVSFPGVCIIHHFIK